MKREKIYEIGKKLGISKSDAKAALLKNRNRITADLIIGISDFMLNRIWFEPLQMNKLVIYNLGNELGLNNDEIRKILNNSNETKQQAVLTSGPYQYPGTHYGTISIKDFI